MTEQKHWAEDILKRLEEETKLVRDIEIESKGLSDELREYLKATSSVGPIVVTYNKSGNILDANWSIGIGDTSVRFSTTDVRNATLVYDDFGDPVQSEKISIKAALEKIVRSTF